MEKLPNIIVIGLGGIGSHLMLPLLQWMNKEIRRGHLALNSITFVDGDKYEEKNKERQFFVEVEKNKALATKEYYEKTFPNVEMFADPRYLDSENISEIIDDKDIILLCVDNNATRKIVEDYCDTLDTFCLISGGNELYDGNVQIVLKIKNEYLTPKLSEVHQEIEEDEGDHPNELSCEELANSEPQISIVNASVADIMRRTFFALLIDGIKYNEVYVNCSNGNIRNEKIDKILKIRWEK